MLADTAELRENDDEVEAEGVRRAEAWGAGADLRIWLVDAHGDPQPDIPAGILQPGDLCLLTKRDLGEGHSGLPGTPFTAKSPNDLAWLEQTLAERVVEALAGAEPPAATR